MWFRNEVRLLSQDRESGVSVIPANDHVRLSPAVNVRVIQVVLFQSLRTPKKKSPLSFRASSVTVLHLLKLTAENSRCPHLSQFSSPFSHPDPVCLSSHQRGVLI